MYNFVDSKLLPKVTSKCSAMERYEVENLISSNFLVKSRGFIAYTTTKPPIDVNFQLICNISLSHIVLSTRIGSHKCSSVEVLVKNSDSKFVTIGKAIYEENGIVLCNSRYYSKNKRPFGCDGYCIVFFRSNEFRSFLNTDFITIRILRTNGTVPCLATVEVWGNISKVCSYETTKTIHRIMDKHNKGILTDNMENLTKKLNNKVFEIPDDFQDALTFDLMAIPMTLPSGHTVDQSSLEKCLANDASCGRHGCDPFTGLKFTDKRKPILNVPLKTRIDMFLIENSHKPEIYSVKRTLGTHIPTCVPDSKCSTTVDYLGPLHTSKKIKLDLHNNSSNLDDVINNVLNNEHFIRFTTPAVEINHININCVICNDKDENLYILPCKHTYCRKCSLKIEKVSKCKVCNVEFFKSSLQRHHC